MHKILITGSNGLTGQKVLALLAGRMGLQLIASSRGPNRHPLREGYRYEQADLEDAAAWKRMFEAHQPRTLIHCAALAQPDECERHPGRCDALNVQATQRLAALCHEHGTHIVFVSTDFVFDGQNGPYAEADLPNPLSHYGSSKLKAEQAIQQSGADWAIARTVLLYGVTPSMTRSNVVLWVKNSLEAGKAIKVVNDQWRTPTLAEDLAGVLVQIALRRVQGLYHISGAEGMSIAELAYRVAERWKLDRTLITEVSTDSLAEPARRPLRTGFVILKAQTELDYRPRNLAQGLALLDRQLRTL